MDASTPRSETGYRGRLGQTQKRQIHWVCSGCGTRASSELFSTVNLKSDPALREPARTLELNRLSCHACGAETAAGSSVVYHDPAREQFVLWIPDSLAYQELQLRAQLLQDLAADAAPLPRYVARAEVLIGAAALDAHLGVDAPFAEAGAALVQLADEATAFLADEELWREQEVLAQQRRELAQQQRELAQQQRELASQWRQLEEQRQILQDQGLALAAQGAPGEPQPPSEAKQAAGGADPQAGDDPLAAAPAHELDSWRTGDQRQLLLRHAGQIYLLAKAESALAQALKDSPPALLLQLRELPPCPLVVLILLPAPARQLPDAQRALYWFLDPLAAETGALFEQLGADFSLNVGIFDEEARPVASFRLQEPLRENLTLIQTRLQELLRQRPAEALDFAGAVAAYEASAGDRLGWRQVPLAPWGREPLRSCAEVLRATRLLSYWARPANLDYLVLIKSFSLRQWRELLRRVISEALRWGLPLGPDLGRSALELGMAESWPALIELSVQRFAAVSRRTLPHDLTFEDEWRIWQQHVSGCAQHDLELDPEVRALVVLADERAAVFAADSSAAADLSTYAERSLLELLADPLLRRDAALELCAREATHLGQRIFAAVCQMSLPEVYRVMPALASLGGLSPQLFLDGLQHRKAFVRLACVLSLGVQKAAADLRPLVHLLLEEPTPLWRAVARVLGELGQHANEALLERLTHCGPAGQERIAVALAYGSAHQPADAAAAATAAASELAGGLWQRVQQLAEEDRLRGEEGAGAGSAERPLYQELTAQFQRALAAEVKELGEGDIVEQEEVLDASDIVDEEVEVVEEDILDPPGG